MLTHQFPCERYPTDEGLTVTKAGPAAAVTLSDGTLSGRGTKLISLTAASSRANVYKLIDMTSPVWWSFYFRMNLDYSSRPIATSGRYQLRLERGWAAGAEGYRCLVQSVESGNTFYPTGVYDYGVVHHAAFGLKLHSAPGVRDGWAQFYFDGVKVFERQNTEFSGGGTRVMLGWDYASYSTVNNDYDELRIGTRLDDVLPGGVTPPAPTGELPQPARTIVVYPQGNVAGLACAQATGVNDGLLCPVPCTVGESLPSYQAYYDQVEFPVKNFLAFQPNIDATASVVVTTPGVPRYFMDGSDAVSTCSRLATLNRDYVKEDVNPLYQTTDRLTYSVLRAAGMFLTSNITDGLLLSDSDPVTLTGNHYSYLTEGYTDRLLRLTYQNLVLAGTLVDDSLITSNEAIDSIAFGESDNRTTMISRHQNRATESQVAALITNGIKEIISDPSALLSLPNLYVNMRSQMTELETVIASMPTLNNDVELWCDPRLQLTIDQTNTSVIVARVNPYAAVFQHGYGDEWHSMCSPWASAAINPYGTTADNKIIVTKDGGARLPNSGASVGFKNVKTGAPNTHGCTWRVWFKWAYSPASSPFITWSSTGGGNIWYLARVGSGNDLYLRGTRSGDISLLYSLGITVSDTWRCLTLVGKYVSPEARLLKVYIDGQLEYDVAGVIDWFSDSLINMDQSCWAVSKLWSDDSTFYACNGEVRYMDMWTEDKTEDWVKRDYAIFSNFINA